MVNHIITLALIMLIAGSFGGFINYLLEVRDNKEKASLLRSLVVGVGASYLVPLFLTMISSSLTSFNEKEPEKYFVFAGFCLIAAISSSAFIRTVSDRILKKAEEAKQIAENVQKEFLPILDKETEIDTDEEIMRTSEANAESKEPVNEDILLALSTNKYTWRSLSGLSKELNIDKNVLREELEKLESNGYVNTKKSTKGGKRWSITLSGKVKLLVG
jgi:hypothetical protein